MFHRNADFTVDELISFSLKNIWEVTWSERQMRRFLTELISGPEYIFDLFENGSRAAVAVLLDRVENPAGDANLEILGMRKDLATPAKVFEIIELAKTLVPSHRRGFQVGIIEGFCPASRFEENGLRPYYNTYKMVCDQPGKFARKFAEIAPANQGDADLVYEILTLSFAQNPEASIPEKTVWLSRFGKDPKSTYFLYHDRNVPVGFAQCLEPDEKGRAEINTIGVLPQYRGQGIGRKLLTHGLAVITERGHSECELSVATANESALRLYTSEGFRITECGQCYRWDKGS